MHLLLDSGDLIELSPGQPDEFVGQIPAFTAQDNGKHTAVLTPWRDVLAGEPVPVDYVIALPPLGFEIGWDTDGIKGSVAAIAVLPDGRPVELGTTDQQGQPRSFLRLRDREGTPLEFIPPSSPAPSAAPSTSRSTALAACCTCCSSARAATTSSCWSKAAISCRPWRAMRWDTRRLRST